MRKFTTVGITFLMYLFSLSTFAALCAFAQSDVASISGFVKDPSGAAVPGAKVVIKNEGVEFERTLTTNNEGYYYVAALPPGLYTVAARARRFHIV